MLSLWELLKSTAGPWVSERVRTCGELLAAAADTSTVDTTQSRSRQAADLLGPKASKLPSQQDSSEPQITRVWQGYKCVWRVKLALLRLQSAKQGEGTRLARKPSPPSSSLEARIMTYLLILDKNLLQRWWCGPVCTCLGAELPLAILLAQVEVLLSKAVDFFSF